MWQREGYTWYTILCTQGFKSKEILVGFVYDYYKISLATVCSSFVFTVQTWDWFRSSHLTLRKQIELVQQNVKAVLNSLSVAWKTVWVAFICMNDAIKVKCWTINFFFVLSWLWRQNDSFNTLELSFLFVYLEKNKTHFIKRSEINPVLSCDFLNIILWPSHHSWSVKPQREKPSALRHQIFV